MPVITFTTDIGNNQWRLSAMKGKLLHAFQDCKIIDFFHDSQAYQISKPAYVHLFSAYQFDFPCIHLIYLQVEKNTNFDLLIIKHQSQYYITPDNGFYTLAFDNIVDTEIYKTKITPDKTWISEVIKIIENIENNSLENHYEKTENTFVLSRPKPYKTANGLSGEILMTDHFGNAYTNIQKQDIENEFPDGRFEMILNNFDSIDKISHTYASVSESNVMIKYSGSGFLKIAINKGNAKQLFGLNEYKKININKR